MIQELEENELMKAGTQLFISVNSTHFLFLFRHSSTPCSIFLQCTLVLLSSQMETDTSITDLGLEAQEGSWLSQAVEMSLTTPGL